MCIAVGVAPIFLAPEGRHVYNTCFDLFPLTREVLYDILNITLQNFNLLSFLVNLQTIQNDESYKNSTNRLNSRTR